MRPRARMSARLLHTHRGAGLADVRERDGDVFVGKVCQQLGAQEAQRYGDARLGARVWRMHARVCFHRTTLCIWGGAKQKIGVSRD